MNQDELYIVDEIKTWVWSGCYDAQQVNQFLSDILEGDVEEEMLRAIIDDEFEKKNSKNNLGHHVQTAISLTMRFAT